MVYNPSIRKATIREIQGLMLEIDYIKRLEDVLPSSWDHVIRLKYKKDNDLVKQILRLRKKAFAILKDLQDRYYKYGEKMVYKVNNPDF